MNDRQRRRLERLTRSRDLALTRSDSFPANGVGGKALANLDAKIEEIENLEAARATSERNAKHGTTSRSDTRATLRERLAAISVTAETIALDFSDFKDKFRRPGGKLNDQTLLGLARSFHTEATLHKARFIEYDMPADFLETLNALIEDFEQAINQQNVGKGGRRAGIVAIDTTLVAAEQDLERLDTAFRNKFAGDAATLAAWESARRLQSAPKTPKKPEPPK
jgi:hypothetical protein